MARKCILGPLELHPWTASLDRLSCILGPPCTASLSRQERIFGPPEEYKRGQQEDGDPALLWLLCLHADAAAAAEGLRLWGLPAGAERVCERTWCPGERGALCGGLQDLLQSVPEALPGCHFPRHLHLWEHHHPGPGHQQLHHPSHGGVWQPNQIAFQLHLAGNLLIDH